jgi:peptidyl-prolyl cis-trans isomerase A (cyclophilin A)
MGTRAVRHPAAILALVALTAGACGGGDGDTGGEEAASAGGEPAAAAAGGDTAAAGATPAGSARADAGQEGPLYRPESSEMTREAPDVYRAVVATTEGEFTMEVHREWAPRGADRFYNLARHGFYEDARFFRVIEGFVAQFGLSGTPELDQLWRQHPIRDDSVARSNSRGTVSFASAGEDTRTTQLFINLADNTRLDDMGFAPIGEVVEGMEVVDALYAGYGEGAPRGAGPVQGRIVRQGNSYLEQNFPQLDYIEEVRVRTGS